MGRIDEQLQGPGGGNYLRPAGLCLRAGILPVLTTEPDKVEDAEGQVENSGSRNSQTDQEHAGLGQSAEEVGQGNPDQEGNGQALNHNKGGMLPAVEISQEAEGDGGQKILKGTALQVVGGCSIRF